MRTGELNRMLALIFCAGSAVMDIRTAKIDNAWILTGACTAVLCQFMQPDERRLTGLFIPLVILFPFFVFRMTGAGDVKLLCILGMFTGARRICDCMLWSFIFAAALSMAVMIDDGCAVERFCYFRGYLRRRGKCAAKEVKAGTAGIRDTGDGNPDVGNAEKKTVNYIRSGTHRENIHLAVPVFASVLLWYGGMY